MRSSFTSRRQGKIRDLETTTSRNLRRSENTVIRSRLGTGRIRKTGMMAIFIINHVTGGIIFRKSKPKKPTTHCVLYHFNVLGFLYVSQSQGQFKNSMSKLKLCEYNQNYLLEISAPF